MKKGFLLLLTVGLTLLSFGQSQPKETQAPGRLKHAPAKFTKSTKQVYFSESFDGTFPATDWTLDPESGSGAWVQNDGSTYGPGSAFDGGFAAMFANWDYSTDTEGSMISPALDLSASSNPVLKFYWWNNDGESSPASIKVSTSTDGETYTELEKIDVFGSGETTWVEYQSFIENTVTHIKITGVSDYGMKNTFVDKLIIEEGPSAPIATLNLVEADFGQVPAGTARDPWGDIFKLTNTGVGTLTITSITDLSSTDFTTTFDETITLGMGESHEFGFTYTPATAGEDVLAFEIETNVGTVTVNLQGEGYVLPEGMVEIGWGEKFDQSMPFEPALFYTYVQSIYLQEEINISTKQIEKIYYHFNGNSAFTDDIVIYLGHIDASELTKWAPVSELTKVYDGKITTVTEDGWVEITLQTPFEYNNTDNLLIAVDENTNGNHTYDDDFYCHEKASNITRIYYSSSTNPDPETIEDGYAYSTRANIRFQFEEIAAPVKYTISGTVTNAEDGNGVENATVKAGIFSTLTAADGTYSLEVNVGNYELVVSHADFAGYTEKIAIEADHTKDIVLLKELLLFSEGFNQGDIAPTGWSYYQEGAVAGWSVFTFSYEGSFSARHYSFTTGVDDWMVSPKTYLGADAILSFKSWMADADCSVLISTGSPNPADNEYVILETLTEEASWNWYAHNLDLSAYTGQEVYIAFRGQVEEGHDWLIDDVQVNTVALTGKVSGTVSLNGGSGELSEAKILIGGQYLAVNTDGTYEVSLAAGTYKASAYLAGYEAKIIENIVVTAQNETTTNIALDTKTYAAPANLEVNDTCLFTWGIPVQSENHEELAYDAGYPNNAVFEQGAYFGNRLTASAPGRVLSLKYATYAESDSVHFDAVILEWDADAETPAEKILYKKEYINAKELDWTVVDLSNHNVRVDGDFAVCLQAWEPVALMVEDAVDNGRSWKGYTQAWADEAETYCIRATVQYDNGEIAEITLNEPQEFVGYDVFLDDMETPVNESIIGWNFNAFEDLNNGRTYTAGVQAVYANGVSEIATKEFTYIDATTGITGQVMLSGAAANIEDVVISSGYASVHPDADGYYTLNVDPGTVNITARLEDYGQGYLEDITVNQGEITENINLVIEEGIYSTVNDLDKDAVNVYPNPAKEVLNIVAPEHSSIHIYNLIGELVYSAQTTENTHKANIENLPNGTYMVRIINSGKVLTKKINVSK